LGIGAFPKGGKLAVVKFLAKFRPGEWIGVVGLAIMGFITFANILARYLFKTSWAFSEELVTGLFLLVSLIGAAIGAERGTLMGLSLFTDFIPKRHQKYVQICQSVFILLFASLLVYHGIGMTRSEWRMGITTAALGIPEAVYGSFVPIGAFFIAVASIKNIVGNVLKKGDPTGGQVVVPVGESEDKGSEA
jgi:C4-dicarboxylate transporter DctQ subunit